VSCALQPGTFMVSAEANPPTPVGWAGVRTPGAAGSAEQPDNLELEPPDAARLLHALQRLHRSGERPNPWGTTLPGCALSAPRGCVLPSLSLHGSCSLFLTSAKVYFPLHIMGSEMKPQLYKANRSVPSHPQHVPVSCLWVCSVRGCRCSPLRNATVESAHLSLQGRQEAYSLKVFASVAASSFNPQLGMWEPLLRALPHHLQVRTDPYNKKQKKCT